MSKNNNNNNNNNKLTYNVHYADEISNRNRRQLPLAALSDGEVRGAGN